MSVLRTIVSSSRALVTGAKDVARFREIATVFVRHGFGWFIAQLKLRRELHDASKGIDWLEMRRDRWRARRPVPANRPDVSDGADRQPEPASADPGPDALLETGEAVEGACRTIIELLPPKQRAVLVLCEVLRCSSGEAAQLLGTTVGAVNSALTPCWAQTRQNAPGSGVPTGLPSYRIVVQPLRRGA